MAVRLRYDFKQSVDDTLDIYLYSDIVPPWEDMWTGERHDEGSADRFRRMLDGYPSARRIRLYVNSDGGDVKEGYGIYAMLKRHPAHKVAFVDGIAASIASIICMAADEIVMYRNAMMVIHNMSCGVYGNAAELRKAADDLDKIMEGNRQVYLSRAGEKLSEEELTKMLDKETWLTAIEAQGFGLCDHVADEPADREITAQQRQALNRLNRFYESRKPEKKRTLKFINL